MPMRVKINSESELLRFAAQVWHILNNLRNAEKKAQEVGGSVPRKTIKYWQDRADEFITTMATKYDNDLSGHVLKINENGTTEDL